MKTLPDSANVDHLRRQAKDLLAVMRQTQPTATLTDAQRSLASQYGYDSWAQLKTAADDKRSAPTAVADEAVVEQLVREFGLGAACGAMHRVERVWAGHVWDLDTTRGRVTLTELFDYVTPENIEIQATLVEQSMAAGIKTPEPLRTRDGAVVARIEGGAWRAHRSMKLGPAPTKPPAPAVAAAAGRALAALHGLAVPPPMPVVAWLAYRRSARDWEALVAAARDAGADWAGLLARAVPRFVELDAVHDDRDPNERAIFSHCWLAPDAVRLAGSNDIVVTNWEHAGPIPPDWELGAALMAWAETGDGSLEPAPARAFLEAYRAAAPEPIDLELRIFVSGVSALLNWCATRVRIALAGDDPVQRDLATRNLPELLSHPVSLAKLEDLMANIT